MTGSDFRSLRKAAGLSQLACALKLGCSRKHVVELERMALVPERWRYAILGLLQTLRVERA